MARLADRAGYDAVWVGDSIVARPRLEPLTTLAYLAGVTTRVRLGTAVLLPALRHPVVLAHQIANVDQISRGRVVLGLGVGWSLPSAEREWAACGADHKRRVRRLEEHVQIWRMLWRGEPVTHHDVRARRGVPARARARRGSAGATRPHGSWLHALRVHDGPHGGRSPHGRARHRGIPRHLLRRRRALARYDGARSR